MSGRVLFLPGAASTSAIWRHAPGRIEQQVVCLDWPRDRLPGFTTLQHVSRWLETELTRMQFDAVVAHSMGGLVALDLLTSGRLEARPVIPVESFLWPPAAFFRNLLWPGANPALVTETERMLSAERRHYADSLLDSLKLEPFDSERLGAIPSGRLHMIYGSRGEPDAARVRSELGWPPEARPLLEAHLVAKAAHFPMLEQPEAFYTLVARLLSASCGSGPAR